jgi:NADH-quinone oxidoreductase subunit E
VATFYNQFRFQPLGRYHIQVCRGTACHVKKSAQTLTALQRTLNLKPGQTTRDGLFSLEVVACLGACGLAPLVAVNGEFHAGATPDVVNRLVRNLRKEAKVK